MDIHLIADILAWIGGICGVALMIMLLFSIFSGSDLDIDLETEADGEGFGIVKSILTFVAIASLTIRAVALHSSWSWTYAILTGIVAGLLAVFVLILLFRFLLQQQEDGSWKMWQAEGKTGIVYVPIPTRGVGKVVITINGADREIEAKTREGHALATGTKILVTEAKKNYLIVSELMHSKANQNT